MIKVNKYGRVQQPYPSIFEEKIKESAPLLEGKSGHFEIHYSPYPGIIQLVVVYDYAGIEKFNFTRKVKSKEIEFI